MQNAPQSLTPSGGETNRVVFRAVSVAQIQRLQLDNARLRTIIAELLLKNQSLRWDLSSQRSIELLASARHGAEREG